MSYIYPTSTTNVSDSFADHVARGSVNPGTDYTAPYGADVYAVAAGIVTDADGNPDGSGGRTIHVNHDDSTGADYLHLSAVSVSAGDRVRQGQRIGFVGGSGDGVNVYDPSTGKGYGAHLHISFRPNHSDWYGNDHNEDFDAIMRGQGSSSAGLNPHTTIPTKEEADMARKINLRVTKDGKTDTDDLFWYSERRGLVRIQTTAHDKLLQRLDKVLNAGASDHFYASEVKIFTDTYV